MWCTTWWSPNGGASRSCRGRAELGFGWAAAYPSAMTFECIFYRQGPTSLMFASIFEDRRAAGTNSIRLRFNSVNPPKTSGAAEKMKAA